MNQFVKIFMVFSVLAIQGCLNYYSGGNQLSLSGFVETGGGVDGSVLTVRTASNGALGGSAVGPQVATASTNRNGLFLAEIPDIGDFRIEAAAGTLKNGQPLLGVLRADIRGYSSQQTVYVNAATTLASAYWDANPGTTPTDAEAAVRSYLRLPPGTPLGAALRIDDTTFSHAEFLKAATAYPSLDAFIAALVADMKVNPVSAHTFQKAPPNPALLQINPAVMWVGNQLASGAVSYVGGLAMGQVIKAMGLGDNSTQEILGALAAINGKLSFISSQLAKLEVAVIKAHYDSIIQPVTAIMIETVAITTALEKMAAVTKEQYLGNKAGYDNDRRILHNRLVNLLALQDPQLKVTSAMTGRYSGQSAAIPLYSQYIKSDKRFFNQQDSREYFLVMDQLQNLHLALYALQLTYYANAVMGTDANGELTFTKAPDENIQTATKSVNQYLSEENQLLPRRLPDNVVIDTRNNWMIHTGPYPYLYYGYDNQIYTRDQPNPAILCGVKQTADPSKWDVFQYRDWLNDSSPLKPVGDSMSLWQIPDDNQILAIFDGWYTSGIYTNPASWAVANGWPTWETAAKLNGQDSLQWPRGYVFNGVPYLPTGRAVGMSYLLVLAARILPQRDDPRFETSKPDGLRCLSDYRGLDPSVPKNNGTKYGDIKVHAVPFRGLPSSERYY